MKSLKNHCITVGILSALALQAAFAVTPSAYVANCVPEALFKALRTRPQEVADFNRELQQVSKEAHSYLETLAVHSQSAKEAFSIAHQADLLQAIDNLPVKKLLAQNGFDIRKYVFGALDSDVGKLGEFWKSSLAHTPENLALASFLKAQPSTKSGAALRAVLDRMGFQGKSLINPALSDQEVLDLLAKPENRILWGAFHEFPGMKFAIEAYERGQITQQQFMDRIETNLFHNGPHEGFWGFFMGTLVPNNAKDSELLTRGTVFRKGEKVAEHGHILPVLEYPSPQCFECRVHTFFDRLSQGTAGGIKKIFAELATAPGSPLAKAKDLLTNNPASTIKQLQVLAALPNSGDRLKPGQILAIQDLTSAGSKRIAALQKFIASTVVFDQPLGGAANPVTMTLHYINQAGVTVTESFTADASLENHAKVARALEELLNAEEQKNGIAIQSLKIGPNGTAYR